MQKFSKWVIKAGIKANCPEIMDEQFMFDVLATTHWLSKSKCGVQWSGLKLGGQSDSLGTLSVALSKDMS